MSETKPNDAIEPVPSYITKIRARVWNPRPDQILSPAEVRRRFHEEILKRKISRQSQKPAAERQRVYRVMRRGNLDKLDRLDKLDIAIGCQPPPRGPSKLMIKAAQIARDFKRKLRAERHRKAAQSGRGR